ncbi:DoxX family protein [Chitinophaga agrisoli]|uniref:DoxX family protein n=1 Tax=Chitinophaga agrisoli TaxID=2607653 RepID=A0A5B2VTA9_9BACT|nr:DoxX family protein [Chitinophaga agrisoli]KAA2241467.1 DoxX family protein [Chitinophaga agrisoli]
MKFVVLLGRILFSLIFLNTLIGHFSPQMTGYAASQGVPAPSFLVPFSGIIAFIGSLSIMFGYKARLGAWLIVIFLIPVSFWMHAFWNMSDPMQAQMNMAMFMKNMSMLGGALIIAYFGAGPLSVDENLARKR